MKKRSFCIAVCMVFLLLIACNKSNSATSPNTGGTPSIQKDPIIITDWADFEFTPGHDVPGTIFQANFIWNFQNGKSIIVAVDGNRSAIGFHEAPQRYDFEKGDPVTIVFKVAESGVFRNIISISSRK